MVSVKQAPRQKASAGITTEQQGSILSRHVEVHQGITMSSLIAQPSFGKATSFQFLMPYFVCRIEAHFEDRTWHGVAALILPCLSILLTRLCAYHLRRREVL